MPIRLDERLTAIASLIRCDSAADIGCDHGKLSYYLTSTDRVKRIIATDISPPSLRKTTELINENGADGEITTRLGDGLDPIESGEVDTVIIAGMGGDVMADILKKAREKGKAFSCFVLSPNTHPEKVRREIANCGHIIVADGLTECAGKYYTIISTRARNAGECEDALDENQLLYGKFYKNDECFKERCRQEIECMQSILDSHHSAELEKKILRLKDALRED